MTITSTPRPGSADPHRSPSSATDARRPPTIRERFAAVLARQHDPSRRGAAAPTHRTGPVHGPVPTSPAAHGPMATDRGGSKARPSPERELVSRPIRSPREKVIERDPTDLAPFRPLPVLTPPQVPVSPPVAHRADLARIAEQVVTRLRVGRSREGALVELRLAVGERAVDLRLVETSHGIELHTDADEPMRRALARELAARGLAITIE